MKKAKKIILLGVGSLLFVVLSALAYVKLALPNVGEAPDLKIGATEERLARGKYLAHHVMSCIGCHSERDWTKFAAPLKEGTWGKGGEEFPKELGFPGTFYAPNITPAGIGHWTDGEIFRAITSGVTKYGKALFPVMPHPLYGQLAEEDIKAVIAYIRTLPAIENKVPPSQPDYAMSFILNTIPKKAEFHPIPDKSDQVSYGKYLITAAACVDCHTQKAKGQNIAGMEYAGGMEFPLPGGITVYSANITPDKATGIGNWTKEAFVSRFKLYADSASQNQAVGKGEFNTIMPWTMFAGMEREDLEAIYVYLQSIPAVNHKVTKFTKN
ncbi:c-type cytochrome [Rufibacter latericius]|uniref:Cytochrome C n=1 Tax=Rufibacter latericius TaxID=2487040 RepID=A0A3M9MD28_9BACT|nr:cytochrome c [Rufibacter latericius]RNI23459.1 cytochrome C [Rufibacter latericius]